MNPEKIVQVLHRWGQLSPVSTDGGDWDTEETGGKPWRSGAGEPQKPKTMERSSIFQKSPFFTGKSPVFT